MEQKKKNLEIGDTVKYLNYSGCYSYDRVKEIVTRNLIELENGAIVSSKEIISVITNPHALKAMQEAYGQAGITSVARPKEREEPPQDFSELFAQLHKLNVQGAIDHALDVGDVVSLKLLTGGAM